MTTNEPVDLAHPDRRLRLRFDAEVVGEGGRIGDLRQVLVHPGTSRVVGLAIRVGFLFSGELQLPLASVVSATAEEIRVSLTAAEARELRRKQETLRRQDRAGAGRALSAPVALSGASRVVTLEGQSAGRVVQLLVHASSGQLTELVVESGLLAPRRWRLPAAWLRRVTDTRIEVDATGDALAMLPPFRSDRDLRADIFDAWFYDERLRATFLRAPLDVKVQEGLATLGGHVSSRRICRRLEERARSVRGVLDVRNTIVTDEELVEQVRSALGSDPRTSMLRPRITCARGVISLEGEAANPSVREAASEVAAAVPRVSAVHNRLEGGASEDPHLRLALRSAERAGGFTPNGKSGCAT